MIPLGVIQQQGGSGSTLLVDLVSWWAMEEASGTRYDAHGSNDLTDGITTPNAAGKVSNAADFEGADYMYKTAPHGLGGGAKSFSCAFWIHADALGTNALVSVARGATAGTTDWVFQYDGGAIKLYVPSASTFYNASGGALSTATWYFVYGEFNYATNTISISVDDGTPGTAAGPTTPNDTGQDFAVGAYLNVGRYFNGRIDEVAYWDRILTGAEITELYNAGNGIGYPG
jgi:hypothetical protein